MGDTGPATYAEVFERAKREHPLPGKFETWFRIVAEAPTQNGFATIDQIKRAVVFQFPHVTKWDIDSHRRTKEVVMPRQIGMYISKAITTKSLPEIGRMFGGRDHTTVLHAVRKIERLIRTDPAVAQDVGEIINDMGCKDI